MNIHMHRWRPLRARIVASFSKRDTDIDKIHVAGGVEVCDRCRPLKYRIRPDGNLHPVELKDIGDYIDKLV